MRRSKLLMLFGGLLVATGLAAACGSTTTAAVNNPIVTTPSTTTTEIYSGSIGLNGAASYNFTVASLGTITATMTTLTGGPANVKVGFSLGTWNGASCSTGAGLFTDSAVQGTVISGATSSSGSLCVRVYDAAGILTTPVSYTVTVIHP